MEELLSLETTSIFSSIAEAPVRLEQQYSPLTEAFQSHGAYLPDQDVPEPNSEAMVRALKALQEKIRGLELDRMTAAEKFKHLSEETQRNAQLLESGTRATHFSSPPAYPSSPLPSTHDLQRRLHRIDDKFSEQAHELQDMKKHLYEAKTTQEQGAACSQKLEQQHRELLQQQKKILQHISKASRNSHVSPSRDVGKVRRLEMDQADLTTAQFETQHKQKDYARETGTRRSPSKRKTKKVVHCTCGHSTGVETRCRCKPVPGIHYRMNLKDVPFLLTTSATPSHSITANYQQMLASMKCHSPLLCGAAAAAGKKRHKLPSSKSSVESKKTGLKSLLTGLEEEFGRLTFEHHELAQRIEEGRSEPSTEQDCLRWERQLQVLVDQMEAKTEQINIVSRQLCGTKAKPRKTHTTHRPKCQELQSTRATNVKFLRKMKAIQATLQQDDLSWD